MSNIYVKHTFLFIFFFYFQPVQIAGPARNWDVFQATVDQELLWNPRHGNYCDWLTTLTVTLIQSGAVQDELLRLLEPVCKRKVRCM